jgi:hypothetical protein
MVFEFVYPILTPAARAAVIADQTLLPAVIFVLISIGALCLVAWYISFETWKAYPRKKEPGFFKKLFSEKK